jgi:transposase
MRAYSLDLRQRVVRAVRERGLPPVEVARRFEVSVWTVKRYVQRAEGGRLAPSPIPGRPRAIGPEREAALAAQWRAAPDARLEDHCASWAAAQGQPVSRRTMSRALTRLGWSRKKRRSSPASATRRRGGSGGAR